ncbi:unnamed protein product [Ilex paraguariensis]
MLLSSSQELEKYSILEVDAVKATKEIDRLKSNVAKLTDQNEELNGRLKEVVKFEKKALDEASR